MKNVTQKLIFPKQVADLNRIITCLEICEEFQKKNNGKPIKNDIFKIELINKVKEFNEKTDKSQLIKQSEICRYFGLITNYNWSGKKGITNEGKEVLANRNDLSKIREIIVNILEKNEVKFGYKNEAVKNSNSNIEPPKLILQSISKLGYCTKNEIAYILHETHVKDIYYEDVIETILTRREKSNWSHLNQTEFKFKFIQEEYHNKLYDIKFITFFMEIDLLYEKNQSLYLTKDGKKLIEFAQFSIYNGFTYNKTFSKQLVIQSAEKLKKYKKSILEKNPANFGSKSPLIKKHGKTKVYQRDPKVNLWILNNANGKCEYCENDAPFVKKDGEPYLEVHHVNYLQNGGADTIYNTVALCPNCHRMAHYSIDEDKIAKNLFKKIKRLVN